MVDTARPREMEVTRHGTRAALGLPAPPQLPNEILPSSGQIGGVAGDEVIGRLATFPLPASQEEHLGRDGIQVRRWEEKPGEGRRPARGNRRPVCVGLHLTPIFALATTTPSLGPGTCSLSPLPPPPYPPSSLCPGAGSRRDTGPDPCPSCPGSACSGLSGPGGQGGAQTPGVHPLPQVGIGLSPPSGSGQSGYQPSPALSRSPVLGHSGRAGRTTHRFLCGKRAHRPAAVNWPPAPRTSPAAQQTLLDGSAELGASLLFCFACGEEPGTWSQTAWVQTLVPPLTLSCLI